MHLCASHESPIHHTFHRPLLDVPEPFSTCFPHHLPHIVRFAVPSAQSSSRMHARFSYWQWKYDALGCDKLSTKPAGSVTLFSTQSHRLATDSYTHAVGPPEGCQKFAIDQRGSKTCISSWSAATMSRRDAYPFVWDGSDWEANLLAFFFQSHHMS